MTLTETDKTQEFRQRLEDAIAAATGRHRRIVDLQRHPTNCSSSYQTERLAVALEDGERLELFAKDFAANHLQKSNLKSRWNRERLVYQKLLAGADLGTARYYGCIGDQTVRGTLLLEHMEGSPLRDNEPHHWQLAATWLAALHAFFARRRDLLIDADFLGRHDEEFFWHQAERTVQSLVRENASHAARVQRVLRTYHLNVRLMVGQPELTLVHGSFKPNDILLDPARSRVCPIDWERAALGSRFFDLAHLTDLMSACQLDQFIATYGAAAKAAGLDVPPAREISHIIDCFHLHRLMDRLRKWPRKQDKSLTIDQLLERFEAIADRVRSSTTQGTA